MRTALSLSLFACASLSLPIWQLSKTLAWRWMAARVRTTWKLLPKPPIRTNPGEGVLLSPAGELRHRHLVEGFSTTAAAGVGRAGSLR